MSSKNGGSAFPNDGAWANGHPEGGMTLRDYFAGQVLAQCSEYMGGAVSDIDMARTARTAKAAYCIADAMLAERAKGGAT